MKRKIVLLGLVLSLLLSGCSFTLLDGEYVYTQPHVNGDISGEETGIHASNYNELYNALAAMVEAGRDKGIIFVSDYGHQDPASDAKKAAQMLRQGHALTAYAVSDITAQLGTTGGEAALAVEISYLYDKTQLKQIREVSNIQLARERIKSALSACDAGIVLLVHNYTAVDFVQIVEDYALEHPEYVIEQPRVSVSVYPDSGRDRVVEITFSYQNSRETLREMQNKVQTMFTSASLYVSADKQQYDKFYHLYTFITERFDYRIEHSITPSYSLLLHGVGDHRAFATVYASMCAREKLKCYVVNGSRNGEAYTWNIISIDGVYYHVDLLRSSISGEFALLLDDQMGEYVWDYDAYPKCPRPETQ
jgi:hypothetical protein